MDGDDPITVTAVAGGTVGTAFELASGATLTLNADGSYSYDASTISDVETTPATSTMPTAHLHGRRRPRRR